MSWAIMNSPNVIGIIASVFTALSLLPQLIKLIKEKKAESVSLGMLFVLFAGLTCWIIYGSVKKDLIIIISNSVSLCISIITFCFTMKYKNTSGK
ncbi:MAG: SemiSWEET transporter [Bacteroidota bacterium]